MLLLATTLILFLCFTLATIIHNKSITCLLVIYSITCIIQLIQCLFLESYILSKISLIVVVYPGIIDVIYLQLKVNQKNLQVFLKGMYNPYLWWDIVAVINICTKSWHFLHKMIFLHEFPKQWIEEYCEWVVVYHVLNPVGKGIACFAVVLKLVD